MSMLPSRRSLWLVCLLAAPFAPATADGLPSLYDRLGGASVMTAVVDELIDVAVADPLNGQVLRKVNTKRLKAKIHEQVCMMTGGPCVFDGDDMRTTHAGHGVTEAHFYRLVEHLVAILDRHGVAAREKNDLLAVLAPLKREVVSR